MAGPRERFIAEQASALGPLDFVILAASTTPPGVVEISRDEGEVLGLSAAAPVPQLPLTEEQGHCLGQLGFSEHDGVWSATPAPDGPDAAAKLVERVLREVFGALEASPIDVTHGTRRPIREAEKKLAALHARLEPLLTQILGNPPTRDPDGDYVFESGSVEVYVSPRVSPGMPAVIRVFAITNVGVNITSDLGLFLARLNFALMFGRFALDVEHAAVWFSETLLGEQVSDEEIRFTIGIVAETASGWDARIAQMFGGYTRATLPVTEAEPTPKKPGEGPTPEQAGYL